MPIVASPPAIAAPAPNQRRSAASFRKAELGMSLEAWRASAPQRSTLACVTNGAEAVCKAPDQPLGLGMKARNLIYRFKGGRLATISYQTSINGFSASVAELRAANGAPAQITHDDVRLLDGHHEPHVEMVWRQTGSIIRLDDPLPRGDRMAVTLSLDQVSPAAHPG